MDAAGGKVFRHGRGVLVAIAAAGSALLLDVALAAPLAVVRRRWPVAVLLASGHVLLFHAWICLPHTVAQKMCPTPFAPTVTRSAGTGPAAFPPPCPNREQVSVTRAQR